MALSCYCLTTSVSSMREGLPEMALCSSCLISSTWGQAWGKLNTKVFSDINAYIAIGQQRAVAIQDLTLLPSAVKPDNIHDILEEATATTVTLPGFWLYLCQVCAAEAWSSFACGVVDIGCGSDQPWILSFLLATKQPFYIVLLFLLGLTTLSWYTGHCSSTSWLAQSIELGLDLTHLSTHDYQWIVLTV